LDADWVNRGSDCCPHVRCRPRIMQSDRLAAAVIAAAGNAAAPNPNF